MNLYLMERTDQIGYDEYVSCVVSAASEEAALKMHPSGRNEDLEGEGIYSTWATPENITVTLIGKSCLGDESKVICASFNAG